MIEEHCAKRSYIASFLIGLLQKSPDATARVVIFGTSLVLAWHSWARWGNFQIDCGRELYIPTQILQGKMLYGDLWFPHGPLASYVEAALLGLFGHHLYVLYLFGICLSVTCALLLFQIGARIDERAAALTAALVLLFEGFEPSLFSYIFPYAYTAPLGLLLGLTCLWFTIRDILGTRSHNLMAAGIAAGLAILCKQEIGVACYGMLAFVLLMKAGPRVSIRSILRDAVEFVPGVALWASIYGWFFWKFTPGFILFDNWQFFPGSYFMRTSGAAYSAKLGFRLIPSEIVLLVLDAVLAVALWYAIARLSRRLVWRWLLVLISLAVVAGTALVRYSAFAMHAVVPIWALLVFPPGMFFIGIGFLIVSLFKLYRAPTERKLLTEAALAFFALVLSVRILAKVEPIGYAIYYDMPLVLVFLVAIVRCARAATSSLSVEHSRKLVTSLLAFEVTVLATVLVPIENAKTVKLETSWGGIYLAPADASVARQIIDFTLAQKEAGHRVVVLPEGHMIYALTGTEAPSRWETIIPGILSPSQEKQYIADLTHADVDYIVLTNRKTAEYGAPYFGIDYNRKIYGWIETNYRVAGQFGQFHRDESQGWAALLYERRASVLPRPATSRAFTAETAAPATLSR
jgi:4-amino-4-deoxy-L-arabinose transferase-like glycosyltransferase